MVIIITSSAGGTVLIIILLVFCILRWRRLNSLKVGTNQPKKETGGIFSFASEKGEKQTLNKQSADEQLALSGMPFNYMSEGKIIQKPSNQGKIVRLDSLVPREDDFP